MMNDISCFAADDGGSNSASEAELEDDAGNSVSVASSAVLGLNGKNKKKRKRSSSAVASSVPTLTAARLKVATRTAVVKIFAKKVKPNYTAPWRKQSQVGATGSGFLIHDKGRQVIVTNAHVVHRATSVLARAQSGPPIKWRCAIAAISVPLDIAILHVEDQTFFKGKDVIRLRDDQGDDKVNDDWLLPKLDSNVTAVGFPVGGEQISVTRGVVSRILVTSLGVLRVQIDAAINAGNSGGPVFNEGGEVVGIASAVLSKAQNIGYVIPVSVLNLFLCTLDETNGKCNSFARSKVNPDGFIGIGDLGIMRAEKLESPALRSWLGLEADFLGGVRISAVSPMGGCSENALRVNDVIVSLDGCAVGQDGSVELPGRTSERIHYSAMVTRKPPGATMAVEIRRPQFNGKPAAFVKENITLLSSNLCSKVPSFDGFDARPSYFFIGGLVFVPLSKCWARAKKKMLVVDRFDGALDERGRQIVVLSKVLAHDSVNIGYHSLSSLVVRSYNGTEPFNLRHLASMVRSSDSANHCFRLSSYQKATNEDDQFEHIVVLDAAAAAASQDEIMKDHMISRVCSLDVDASS